MSLIVRIWLLFTWLLSSYLKKLLKLLIQHLIWCTVDSPLSWDKIASDRDQDGIEDYRKEEQWSRVNHLFNLSMIFS